MKLIAFVAAILSVFVIRPVVTYNTDCEGTEIVDVFGNIYGVYDELPEGKWLAMIDTMGTADFTDDEIILVLKDMEVKG